MSHIPIHTIIPIKKGNTTVFPSSLQGLISLQIPRRNVPKYTQLHTNNINSLFKKNKVS